MSAVAQLAKIKENIKDYPNVRIIAATKYFNIDKINEIIDAGITEIGENAFRNCVGMTEVTFKGSPQNIWSDVFYSSTNITTINVPWSEGEVAGAPWGAVNATVNYNYTD